MAQTSSPSHNHANWADPSDTVEYVLMSNLRGEAIRMSQMDAFLRVQNKVSSREDTSHALLISANVLSLAVMSSQLSMYRWKVSEAQTSTEAVAILQDQIHRAKRKGFSVNRRTGSRNADINGRNRSTSSSKRTRGNTQVKIMGVPADQQGGSAANASSGGNEGSNNAENRNPSAASMGSSEDSAYAEDERCNLAPSGTVTRLVVVDSFTHEMFDDILHHLRYIDDEYGLDLVIVLLLHTNDELLVQGPGIVVSPQASVTMDEAYKFGFDLVLNHYFDHLVVDFLTETFMSSAGRWRNDVRSKAAVGNYVSVRNILTGKADMALLRSLLPDDLNELEIFNSNDRQQGYGNSRDDNFDELLQDGSGLLPPGLGQLRQQVEVDCGVRIIGDQEQLLGQPRPLIGLTSDNDALATLMNPTDSGKRRRVKHGSKKGTIKSFGSGEEGDFWLNSVDENREIFTLAIEQEIQRLTSENESQKQAIQLLQEELERSQRMVDSMKNKAKFDPQGGERRLSGTGDSSTNRPTSATLVHLTKEQQIYMLKQRLDAANEQISQFIEDGGPSRNRARMQRGTLPARSNSPSTSKSAASKRRVSSTGSSRVRRKAFLHYSEVLERGMMASHDHDATAIQAHGIASSEWWEAIVQEPSTPKVKEQEKQAEQLIKKLQHEVKFLSDQRQKGALQASADISTVSERFESKLKSSLDLIQAQKKRIEQLETLRRLDAALNKSNAAQRGTSFTAVAGNEKILIEGKKGAAKGRSKGSIEAKAKLSPGKPKTNIFPTPRKPPGSPQSPALETALEKLRHEHAKATAVMRREYEAEIAKAVKKALHDAELQRERADIAKTASIQKELEVLYLKIRRPYVKEFRDIQLHELVTATNKIKEIDAQLGLLQRDSEKDRKGSDFKSENTSDTVDGPLSGERSEVIVRSLSRMSESAHTPASKSSLLGSNMDISNEERREKILALARERAFYTLQVENTSKDIQEIDEAWQDSGFNYFKSLCKMRKDRWDNIPTKLDTEIMDEMIEIAKIDNEISRWGNVPLESILTKGPDLNNETLQIPVSLENAVDAIVSGKVSHESDLLTIESGAGNVEGQKEREGEQEKTELLSTGEVPTKELEEKKGLDAESLIVDQLNSISLHDVDGVVKAITKVFHTSCPAALRRKTFALQNGTTFDSVEQDGGSPLGEVQKLSSTNTQENPNEFADLGTLPSQIALEVAVNENLSPIAPDYQKNIQLLFSAANGTWVDDVPENIRSREMYYVHHQEMMRLIGLLTIQYPVLADLTSYVTQSLEEDIANDLGVIASNKQNHTSLLEKGRLLSLPLLIAVDTALVQRFVDFLGDVLVKQVEKRRAKRIEQGLPPLPNEEIGIKEIILSTQNRSGMRLPICELSAKHGYRELDDSHEAGVSDEHRDRRKKSEKRKISEDNGSSLSKSSVEFGEAEQFHSDRKRTTAIMTGYKITDDQDQPEKSSPHRTTPSKEEKSKDISSLTGEEIYGTKELLSFSSSLDESEDDSENLSAIKKLKEELNYLNELKKERIQELMLRQQLRKANGSNKRRADASPARTVEEEREVHLEGLRNFEKAQGNVTKDEWYGMDAAKRVQEILKRRTTRDQLLIGGSNFDAAGIELSARMAATRQSLQLGEGENAFVPNKAGRSAMFDMLPPIENKGLSRQQQQLWAKYIGSITDQNTLMTGEGCVITPDELVERLFSFSKRGLNVPRPPFPYPSYFIPLTANLPSYAIREKVETSKSPVDFTSWVYGIPKEEIEPLFRGAPTSQNETVVFVPRSAKGCSERLPATMGNSPFITPATLAAQRLNAILNNSIQDVTLRSKQKDTTRTESQEPSLASNNRPKSKGNPPKPNILDTLKWGTGKK